MKQIMIKAFTFVIFCFITIKPSHAGYREIGGYVDKAQYRFVNNVWNFVKEFQTIQTVGTNTWINSQYYYAEPRFFMEDHLNFVDKMDLAYCSGHGNSYYFQTNWDLSEGVSLNTAPGYGTLPSGDLEFIIIESCLTVVPYADDHNYRDSWQHIFQGLHQLVGFRTLSVSDNGIPNDYANKLKCNGGVWQSWFEAVNDERIWAWVPTHWVDLGPGVPYPGYASAVVYVATENDKLGNYVSADPSGTSGMHSWWQY